MSSSLQEQKSSQAEANYCYFQCRRFRNRVTFWRMINAKLVFAGIVCQNYADLYFRIVEWFSTEFRFSSIWRDIFPFISGYQKENGTTRSYDFMTATLKHGGMECMHPFFP